MVGTPVASNSPGNSLRDRAFPTVFMCFGYSKLFRLRLISVREILLLAKILDGTLSMSLTVTLYAPILFSVLIPVRFKIVYLVLLYVMNIILMTIVLRLFAAILEEVQIRGPANIDIPSISTTPLYLIRDVGLISVFLLS